MKRRYLITLLSLVLLTVYFFTYQEQTATTQKARVSDGNERDYYLLKTSTIEYAEDGRITYRFKASGVEHFPKGDYALVANPHLVVIRKDGTPWHVDADHGRVFSQNDKVILWDNVVMKRMLPEDPAVLKTAEMTLFPKKEYAETDKPVFMTSKNARVEAVGMEAFIDESRVKLLNNVKVRHAPQTRS